MECKLNSLTKMQQTWYHCIFSIGLLQMKIWTKKTICCRLTYYVYNMKNDNLAKNEHKKKLIAAITGIYIFFLMHFVATTCVIGPEN